MAKTTSIKTAVSNIVKENGAGVFNNPREFRRLLDLQGVPEESSITAELMLSACPALTNALAAGVISRMEANALVSMVIQKTSLTPSVTRKMVGELFLGRGVSSSEYSVAGELKYDSYIGDRLSENLRKKGYRWSLIDDSEEYFVAEARKRLYSAESQDAALSELDRLAEEGNAESNYAIGEYFYELSGNSLDVRQESSAYEQARRYMERSAKLGYGPAYGALAEMEIISSKGSLEKAAEYLAHPISIKGFDGRRWSNTVDWMTDFQHDNARRADSILLISLVAVIVSVLAFIVHPVFGIAGLVLSLVCAVRAVFSKFRNKYLSHVPEMALLTLAWFLMILALL